MRRPSRQTMLPGSSGEPDRNARPEQAEGRKRPHRSPRFYSESWNATESAHHRGDQPVRVNGFFQNFGSAPFSSCNLGIRAGMPGQKQYLSAKSIFDQPVKRVDSIGNIRAQIDIENRDSGAKHFI